MSGKETNTDSTDAEEASEDQPDNNAGNNQSDKRDEGNKPDTDKDTLTPLIDKARAIKNDLKIQGLFDTELRVVHGKIEKLLRKTNLGEKQKLDEIINQTSLIVWDGNMYRLNVNPYGAIEERHPKLMQIIETIAEVVVSQRNELKKIIGGLLDKVGKAPKKSPEGGEGEGEVDEGEDGDIGDGSESETDKKPEEKGNKEKKKAKEKRVKTEAILKTGIGATAGGLIGATFSGGLMASSLAVGGGAAVAALSSKKVRKGLRALGTWEGVKTLGKGFEYITDHFDWKDPKFANPFSLFWGGGKNIVNFFKKQR